MLLKLLRNFFGFVKIEIYGFAPERLMNLLIKNEIVIWDVEKTDSGYIFFIGRKNLLMLRPYLQKTNMKFKIIKKYGLPYFFRKNRRRSVFAAGCLCFFLTVYVLSLFIWEVKVTGQDHLVAEEMLKHIEQKYIPLGTLKSDIDCSELEKQLRKDYEEISWISCELKGTGLTVHLEEGLAPQANENNDFTGDIVASKDAYITKMITRQGTPIAKVDETVKKGDILISGTVYIYDDNNEIMETNYIAADGDVYGKTSYTYNDYVDLKYYEKEYTEKAKKHITLFFMDYCLTPYLPKMNSQNYDTYTQIHKLRLFHNFYLPVGYKVIKRTTYNTKAKIRTEDTASEMLKERFSKKIEDFKENGLEIIENNVTIEKVDDRLEAKGNIVVIESIAKLKETNNDAVKSKPDQ